MAIKRFKSNFPGVRYREHPTRKHGIKHDRYFSIYYRVNGKKREEGLGWASQGWTAQKAAHELSKLKESHRVGSGPQTLKEKRNIEYNRREQEAKDTLSFSSFFKEHYFPLQDIKKSCEREEEIYKLWIEPVIGNVTMKDVSPIHLERIKKNMSDAGRAPRTIHYCLAVIRQVFNYAKRINLYSSDNPVGKVKKPTFDNKRVRFLAREEADKLLKELQLRSPELHDMAILSLHSGLRAGEIFNLTWGDIDIEKGIVLLKDTKTGKNRFAYMTNEVKKMLSVKQKGKHNEPVFMGRGGKIKNVSNTFDRTVKDLGLNTGVTDPRQKIVFHSLRHTYASWLVESGVDLYTVKKLLGHSSIAMTERYSHLGQNTLQNAVRVFENSLKSQQDKVVEMKK
jgi:integrase